MLAQDYFQLFLSFAVAKLQSDLACKPFVAQVSYLAFEGRAKTSDRHTISRAIWKSQELLWLPCAHALKGIKNVQ